MQINPDNVILEIRGGVGGEEAKIWADDLTRMYNRFAASCGWKVESLGPGVIKISGSGVFPKLKFEGGVHRVQRIPKTERRGRLHTSTATVAVLPEIPEAQIYINPADCEWQLQKVSSAVRLIHKPTEIVVTSQAERDQWQNRQLAMTMLRAKLFELEEERKRLQLSDLRQVIGRGMRAEKIRTYNFPQNRVTDHRIGKSWGNLESIIDGELDKLVEATSGIA
ncbi:MAG: peptide chain release factor 1 [Microgenomates group bacterium LiPW_16]|nr:MAG: peptide chain release factor 1 [Microgenomates group bacterium LiPW_16]